MKILLIVPDVTPRLDTVPEIRTLTSLHQVTVLSGNLSSRELYEAAQRGNYDIIHIGAHTDTLDREDVLQVARVASASLVVLNACSSGAMASFLVAHGIPYVISTNIELFDAEAWKMPLTFYEYVARQEHHGEVISFPSAFGKADTGDGDYSLSVSVERINTMSQVTQRIEALNYKLNVTVVLLSAADVFVLILWFWGRG